MCGPGARRAILAWLPVFALHYRALVHILVIGGSGLLGLRITRQAQLAGHDVMPTFHASPLRTPGGGWRELDVRRRDDVTALALDARRRDRRPLLRPGAMPRAGRRSGLGPAGAGRLAARRDLPRRRHRLLIAARDGLDPAALPVGPHAATGRPGALDVRLDSSKTQAQLTTRLRGAREFLAPTQN
jgi:hypothetical protein